MLYIATEVTRFVLVPAAPEPLMAYPARESSSCVIFKEILRDPSALQLRVAHYFLRRGRPP